MAQNKEEKPKKTESLLARFKKAAYDFRAKFNRPANDNQSAKQSDKKFELTGDEIQIDDRALYAIRALRNIDDFGVKKGDVGGYIEKEDNLSQQGSAWVGSGARVSGLDTHISGNSLISGTSTV